MKEINTIIIGAGRVGNSLAKDLEKTSNVLIIDKDKNKLARLVDFSGFIEVGDATDISFLRANGIEEADTVVITTDDDNTNIFLSDVCYYLFSRKNIFIRLKDSRKSTLVNKDVKCICPFDLSISDFERQLNQEVK